MSLVRFYALLAIGVLAATFSVDSSTESISHAATVKASAPVVGSEPGDGVRNAAFGGQTLVRYVRGDTPEESDALRIRLQAAAYRSELKKASPAIAIARSYGPCTLHPGIVYLRKEYDYTHVGMKPLTHCNKALPAPSLIEHRTDLRYHWFNWWLQAGDTFVRHGGNAHSYLSKSIHFECVGTEVTVWSGTTLGKIIWRGHTYWARVYQSPRELKCGAHWP